MKRIILLPVLVVLIAVLGSSSASAVPAKDTSPISRDVYNDEIATNQTQSSNSSASATITIIMYAVDEE